VEKAYRPKPKPEPRPKPQPKLPRWLLWLIPAMPLGFIVACFVAFLSVCTVVGVDADYGDMELHGADGEYVAATSQRAQHCRLYLDVPGHGPTRIGDVTEAMMPSDARRSEQENGTVHYTTSCGFTFREGKLQDFHLYGDDYRFSRKPDGPWVTLPMAYRQFHRQFGEPKSQTSDRSNRRFDFH
jgi:hypothetical protein